MQYAVGRIHFDTLQEYARVRARVVAAETAGVSRPRQAAFFGVRNPEDQATRLSADDSSHRWPTHLSVELRVVHQHRAGRGGDQSRLGVLLGGPETPALLFTASHGMGFPNGDARQFPHQGALLCQDWPGPLHWRGRSRRTIYFAGDDIPDDARLMD